MYKFLLPFILLCGVHTGAQAPCDSLVAEEFKQKAIQSLEDGRKEESGFYRDTAAQLFKNCNDLKNWMHLYRRLGATYRERKDYEAALAQFRTALDGAWRKPAGDTEYRERAWVYAQIGYTYKKLNEQRLVVESYEKAAFIFTDTLKTENTDLAKFIYGELANAYNRLRDYEKAAFYHQRRKDILLKAQQWDDAAGALSDLGMVHLNREEYPEAIAVFSEGLALGETGFAKKVLLMFNIGLACLHSGDYEKAFDYTRRCEQLILREKLPRQEKAGHLVWVFDNYARYYKAKKDFKQAERYYSRMLREIAAADPADRRSPALSLVSRGNLYLEWDKPAEASADFRAALRYLLPGFSDKTPYALPPEEQLVAEPTLLDALGGLAESFAALEKPEQPDNANAAQCFDLAAKVESLLLQLYMLEDSRLTALQEHRWVKSENLAFTFERWNKTRLPELQEKMFSVSEQSRALLLWEGVEISKAFASDELGALQAACRRLNREIENLEQTLFEEEDKLPRDSIEMRLLKARREKADLLKKAASGSAGAKIAQQRNPVSLQEVKQSLTERQVLIEYFIHDRDAYIFAVSPRFDGLFVQKIAWGAEWSQAATSIKEDILAQNNAAYLQKARMLYDQLIRPVLDVSKAEHLIIIPDGELWNVPFDALLTRDVAEKEQRNCKDWPYLLKEKSISYGFSATLQHEMYRGQEHPGRKKLLAFAPAYRKIKRETPGPVAYALRRNLLDTLLYNAAEAKAISRLAGGYIGGANASKSRFLQSVARADILHLAAHAKANRQNPAFSFLAFTNTGDTLREPYKLYAHELYHYALPLEMAVLSACETGTGTVRQGEGVMSLARAFVSGGTKSVVTSLWSIDDKATKGIMESFYKNLEKGQSKDRALREAKLSYIRRAPDHDRAHPLYWAAFVPIGNMEPLQLDVFPWTTVVLLALAFGLCVALLWRYRKKV